MITTETASNSSEHWLTTMTCTVCENTPDSPAFKCPTGHLICTDCFTKLKRNGLIRCKNCLSSAFRKQETSKDPDKIETKSSDKVILPEARPEEYKSNITIEQLFQMTSAEFQKLFQFTAREKLRSKALRLKRVASDQQINVFHNFERGDTGEEFIRKILYFKKSMFPILLSNNEDVISLDHSLSKKPILCLHNSCKKIVTISSFAQHFKYDHRDLFLM
ncbi:hypothetical protein FQR65_LT09191 [Abscondita terminalis]|nr:hypothetical protein FQR65_LT09191 [Abscondita terminalis]